MSRIITFIIVVALLIVILPDFAMSQVPPGLPGDPAQAPIDGGLGILAALGGTYAIKKLRDRKKA